MRWIIGCALLGLALHGCSGGAEGGKRVPVYKVTGKIMMSGAPLIDATVAFTPTEPGQPIAIGRTNDEGVYSLTTYDTDDGAALGKFAVTVMKFASAESTSSAAPASQADYSNQYQGGPSHDAKKAKSDKSSNLIPDLYGRSDSTPFKATVEEKNEPFVFEIK